MKDCKNITNSIKVVNDLTNFRLSKAIGHGSAHINFVWCAVVNSPDVWFSAWDWPNWQIECGRSLDQRIQMWRRCKSPACKTILRRYSETCSAQSAIWMRSLREQQLFAGRRSDKQPTARWRMLLSQNMRRCVDTSSDDWTKLERLRIIHAPASGGERSKRSFCAIHFFAAFRHLKESLMQLHARSRWLMWAFLCLMWAYLCLMWAYLFLRLWMTATSRNTNIWSRLR